MDKLILFNYLVFRLNGGDRRWRDWGGFIFILFPLRFEELLLIFFEITDFSSPIYFAEELFWLHLKHWNLTKLVKRGDHLEGIKLGLQVEHKHCLLLSKEATVQQNHIISFICVSSTMQMKIIQNNISRNKH